MKIKKISMLLSVLAFVLLTSVGFAAWVITGDATGNAEGNITTETVVDNRIEMTVEIIGASGDTNPAIHFGKPAGADNASAWLKAVDAKEENLSLTVVVKITNWDTIKNNIDVTGSITISDVVNGEKSYTAAKEMEETDEVEPSGKKTVELLGELPTPISITNKEFADGEGTVEKTLTFSWGSAFNRENPYTYYNALTSDKADEAIARLKHIEEKLTGVTYKVTVIATAGNKSGN